MSFDYEQSIWGKGYASLSPTSLASFRLQQALAGLETVPDGGSVMELGAGAGQFIRSIKKVRQTLDCYGCDISAEAIRLAVEAHDGVVYAVNNEVLPYADASLDAVLIFDVLEHVIDPLAILLEVKRILKPGGLLYAYVPCEGDWLSLWNICHRTGWKGDLTKKYAGHINYFSRHSLRSLYDQAGFSSAMFHYSEHIIGQLLMFVTFNLMDRSARKRGLHQINGEHYFEELHRSIRSPRLFSLLKNIVNSLVYFESWLFNRVPSPNVHSFVRK